MRTAFGYIRVSTDEQADSGLGLEAQRQRIRAPFPAEEFRSFSGFRPHYPTQIGTLKFAFGTMVTSNGEGRD